jgi:hypothetical protein
LLNKTTILQNETQYTIGTTSARFAMGGADLEQGVCNPGQALYQQHPTLPKTNESLFEIGFSF